MYVSFFAVPSSCSWRLQEGRLRSKANQLIQALQKATQQLQGYITELETKVDSVQRKR